MKHLKHLSHSNKNPTSVVDKIKPWRKEFSNLQEPEGSICTLTSRVTGKHLWPQHNFQKVIRHKHSPFGVSKFSFHREIFVKTEETLSDAHFTLISTVITGVPSSSFQSFIGVLAKIPSRIMSFSAEKQKEKTWIYINHSDLTGRTGHWIENQCLKYLKKVLCFQTVCDRQRKSAHISLCWCTQNF